MQRLDSTTTRRTPWPAYLPVLVGAVYILTLAVTA